MRSDARRDQVRVTRRRKVIIVNEEGELLAEHDETHRYLTRSEEYVQTFYPMLDLQQRMNGSQQRVCSWLFRKYAGVECFVLNLAIKKEIAAACELQSPQSVSNILSDLSGFGVMLRVGEGKRTPWRLNPRLVWKGSQARRKQLILELS